MSEFRFLPFQLAMVFGCEHRDILDWVEKGWLEVIGGDRLFTIPIGSAAKFVHEHSDLIPQLYKEAFATEIHFWRHRVIEEVEIRWPFDPSKLQNVSE